MVFNIMEKPDSNSLRFLVTRSTRVLGETINHKTDSVGLLLGIKR